MKANKIIGIINVDSVIDLITNSSSELFIIEGDFNKEIIAEMVNSALEGVTKITPEHVEERIFKDYSPYETVGKIDEIINNLSKDAGDKVREILSKPGFFAVSFDRDWVYTQDRDHDVDVRDRLYSIGFTLYDTDY